MEKCCMIGVKKNDDSKDLIHVTCIHGKTLPINQARAALGMRPLSVEEQEEILRKKGTRK